MSGNPYRKTYCKSYLLLLLLVPFVVGAGEKKTKQAPDFWGNLARPGHKRFVAAIARGKKFFNTRIRDRRLWKQTMGDALAAFRDAVKASPDDPTGHYWVARSLYELERMPEAIRAFGKVRRLDPAYPENYTISFSLGIAYSKLGKFGEAVREYDRAERIASRRSGTRTERSTLQGNAAEALMALGRLDEAIQRYREAVTLQPGYVLAWWGLAVALDRDEQVSKAMAAVQRAVSYDKKMRRLTAPGVFFIPRGDASYYKALGHLALGNIEGAKKAFKKFITELPKSPWAFRARDHLAALGVRNATKPTKRKRLAPVPKPTLHSESNENARSTIRYRLRSHVSKIRSCYQRELSKRKGLAGNMSVSFLVTAKGKVARARLLSSTLQRPALHACVLSTIRKIKFGRLPISGSIKMIYPFEFKPR